MGTSPANSTEREARLHRAGWLLAPLLSLLALLILASPASADGGLLDAVTDLVGEATDEVADAPLVEELLDPVDEVLPEIDVQATVEVDTPIELVPTIGADVAASTDILTSDVELEATVEDVIDVGADLTVDLPAAEIDATIEVEVPVVDEVLTPELPNLPPLADPEPPVVPVAPAEPVVPVPADRLPVDPAPATPGRLPISNMVVPPQAALPDALDASRTPPLTVDQAPGQPPDAIARVVDTIAAALAETTSGAIAGAARTGVAVAGILAILALIPPTLIGRLIPPSAVWRSMFLALPPDPPG